MPCPRFRYRSIQTPGRRWARTDFRRPGARHAVFHRPVNGVAVDPINSNDIYVASDSGGIWRSMDGGKTWSPRTDQTQMYFQTINVVHRAAGDTIYAFDQEGNLWTSTDGATTFTSTAMSPFLDPLTAGPPPFPITVNKLDVVVTDPTDQTKDILYAAVGTVLGPPPSAFLSPAVPEAASGDRPMAARLGPTSLTPRCRRFRRLP